MSRLVWYGFRVVCRWFNVEGGPVLCLSTVWCVVCVLCAVLDSSEAGLCFASCNVALPLVLCEVAPWCDLPWCGMWYVVCGVGVV